jgi:hypothetical protein
MLNTIKKNIKNNTIKKNKKLSGGSITLFLIHFFSFKTPIL